MKFDMFTGVKFDLFASQIADLKALLPWNQVNKEKKALRGLMEQRRRILTEEQVEEQSAAIIRRIEDLRCFQRAQVVVLYYPLKHEVNLKPLLEKYWQQKTLLLPVTHHHRKLTLHPYKGAELMRRGRHRVPEPTTEEFKGHLDLIIVPGVCFDEKGNRLGRGGGYYDSFLKQHPNVHKVGVCFDSQLRKHKEVPHHHFDKPVNVVVTSNRTIGE